MRFNGFINVVIGIELTLLGLIIHSLFSLEIAGNGNPDPKMLSSIQCTELYKSTQDASFLPFECWGRVETPHYTQNPDGTYTQDNK
jgi:hypothetical protein